MPVATTTTPPMRKASTTARSGKSALLAGPQEHAPRAPEDPHQTSSPAPATAGSPSARPPVMATPSSSRVQSPAWALQHDPPLVHDHDPVGQRHDLVELERDQQHRRGPRRAAREGARGRTRWRPTSRPRVGWAAMSAAGSRSISRASTVFCWLPPDRLPAGVCGPPPRTSKRASRRLRVLDDPPRAHPAEAGDRRAVVLAEHEVLGQVEVEDEAEAVAVLRDQAQAGLADALRRRAGDVLAAHHDRGRRPAGAAR